VKIDVTHPVFQKERLTIETVGLLQTPRLLVNGSVVKSDKGKYSIPSDSGEALSIRINRNFFDPVPRLKIDNIPITLARSLTPFEYFWFIFLFFSMANISPVGGLAAAIGAVMSARVFRGNYSTPKKLSFIVLIFVGAIFSIVVVKVLFQLLTGRPLQ
jgi:hypothetical protein